MSRSSANPSGPICVLIFSTFGTEWGICPRAPTVSHLRSGSMYIMKSIGERTSPWMVPLCICMGDVVP